MDSNEHDSNEQKGPSLTNNKDTAPSLSEKDFQSGIDIRQALDILSSRPPNDHFFRQDCDGGEYKKSPLAVLKNMGQKIDLFAPSHENPTDSPRGSPKSTTESTTPTSDSGTNALTSVEQRQKIRNGLKDLPFIALLKLVLTTQEDRVRTYQLYDEALGRVLISNRLSDYPSAVVAATAAFAVLSNTISAVRDELSDRVSNRKDQSIPGSVSSIVIKSIRDLQDSEREKLQLTAAYHLEKIRANNLKQHNTSENFDKIETNDDNIDALKHELSFLNNGIVELRSRIEACRSDINDVIEDLKCALVEQIEEQEEQQPCGNL